MPFRMKLPIHLPLFLIRNPDWGNEESNHRNYSLRNFSLLQRPPIWKENPNLRRTNTNPPLL